MKSSALFWSVMALALASLLVSATPAFAAEVRGTIKSVDAANQRFVLTDTAAKDYTFDVRPESRDRLKSVKPGDRVTVSYEVQGGKIIATSIEKN
jgi:hypothetical protein